jgi:hypothetical protein
VLGDVVVANSVQLIRNDTRSNRSNDGVERAARDDCNTYEVVPSRVRSTRTFPSAIAIQPPISGTKSRRNPFARHFSGTANMPLKYRSS